MCLEQSDSSASFYKSNLLQSPDELIGGAQASFNQPEATSLDPWKQSSSTGSKVAHFTQSPFQSPPSANLKTKEAKLKSPYELRNNAYVKLQTPPEGRNASNKTAL